MANQQGLTLIEMIMTIVILAIALVTISISISGGISRSSNILLETRAVALAQSYLDEILGKRFDEQSSPRGIPPCRDTGDPVDNEESFCTPVDELGPEPQELGRAVPRAWFNDVDDYNGLDEGYGQADPLLDAEGVERQGYENFRVRVSVRYVQPCDGGPEAFFNVPVEVCEPADEESETTLRNAIFAAKLITVTVSHRSNADGWHYSVYKANF